MNYSYYLKSLTKLKTYVNFSFKATRLIKWLQIW